MKMRLCLVLSSAVIIGLLAFGNASAAVGLPKWLIVRVHSLVVSDQSQGQAIAALQSAESQDQASIQSLQSQLSAADAKLACLRTLKVSVAHVRALNGRRRYVLRVPNPVGRPPFANLVRSVC